MLPLFQALAVTPGPETRRILCSSTHCDSIFHTSVEEYEITGLRGWVQKFPA